jgi:hypothetical protein
MNDDDIISNRHPRAIGLALLVVGLICAKLQIYDPLHAAEMGREKVWVYWAFVALGVSGPIMGLLFLVFGSRPNVWFKFDPQNLRLKNVLALLAFAGAQLAILFYILRALELQGYREII